MTIYEIEPNHKQILQALIARKTLSEAELCNIAYFWENPARELRKLRDLGIIQELR